MTKDWINYSTTIEEYACLIDLHFLSHFVIDIFKHSWPFHFLSKYYSYSQLGLAYRPSVRYVTFFMRIKNVESSNGIEIV